MILTAKEKMVSLSYGSKKKILVRCDYCNKKLYREYRKQLEIDSNKKIDKDSCLDCLKIKNSEIYLLSIDHKDISTTVSNMISQRSSLISGVYSLRDKINNKSYIGSSKDIIQRWKSHFQKSGKNNHYVDFFRNVDIENIEFIILEDQIKESELVSNEYKYIQLFRTNDRLYGYNIASKTRKKYTKKNLMSVEDRTKRGVLTVKQVENIKSDIINGKAMKELSNEYGVHYNSIQSIKSCQTWSNVSPHLNEKLKNIRFEVWQVGSNNPDSKLDEKKLLK